jgi:SAM-dependent methyltransferase
VGSADPGGGPSSPGRHSAAPQGWEDEAARWLLWTRTPGHDAYWQYRDGFFDEIVPAPGRRTLEIGCGEGRVSRDLADRGHAVVGIDTSPTLIAHARDADPRPAYVRADAAALPFPDGAFDGAVAYNSLMDVDDLAATVSEAARVLEPGSPLCVTVTHPLNDAGRFVDRTPDAPFTIDGSYLGRHAVDDTVEHDGLRMRFRGWRYPLEGYVGALTAHGFVVEALREPRPREDRGEGDARWHRVPMFLQLRARRR